MKRLLCIFFIVMSGHLLFAQRGEQLWLDYQVDLPFANTYLFEVTSSYQTLLDKDDKWRSGSVSPTLEYQYFGSVDIIGSVPIQLTMQTTGSNSFEFTPSLAARFHVTQGRRIDSRIIPKLEQRMFYQVEEKDWNSGNRLRLKAEVWISINGPNLFTDRLWYGILDYEEFIVVDQQLEERYANRRRARMGVGYRHNYRNRFELIYTRQSSRNEIEGEFISNDNVIQIRFKTFLNPGVPDSSE